MACNENVDLDGSRNCKKLGVSHCEIVRTFTLSWFGLCSCYGPHVSMSTLARLVRTSGDLRFPIWAVFLATLLGLSAGCREVPSNPFTQLDDARELGANLRVQFSKAVDFSNRAV